jgi:hypothetical protein
MPKSQEKLPGYVSLSDVSEHTDRLDIGNLGLPSGLDVDAFQIHVWGLVKSAEYAGIGHVSLTGARGEATEYTYGAKNINSDGTATFSLAMIQRRAKLSSNYNQPIRGSHVLPRSYTWMSSAIEINNTAVEERIQEDGDKWTRGTVNPHARAKYMDKAVRYGLAQATKESLFSTPMHTNLEFALLAAMTYGAVASHSPLLDGIYGILWGPRQAIEDRLIHLGAKSLDVDLPPRKWTIVPLVPLDRFAAASVVARSTKFIRPTPTNLS